MSSRKPGDWDCRSCGHLNFSRRESCQRCGDPRSFGSSELVGGGYGRGGGGGGSGFGFDVRPGDWYCSCGTHNFASRTNCFRCGAFKDEASSDGGDAHRPRAAPRAGWKSGDWICTRAGCNEHNFASRMECFRCNAPRDDSGTQV